jgi:hypothetical protein
MIKHSIRSLFVILVLIWLPFDLNFTSKFIPPKILNEAEISSELKSKNIVVLITIDGMLASCLNFSNTPFLFQKIQEGGRMGFSWTKAPTESRPAHQAILGGFWEDPSNIFRFWTKSNGKDDHIFNNGQNFLALGGPDVVGHFAGNKVKSKIKSYPLSDYKTVRDTTDLDRWVLHELKMENYLRDYKFIFCHLAGVDTTGHRHGSTSQVYRHSVKEADEIVKEIVELFPVEKTNFIVMSDHGFAIKPEFSQRHDLDYLEAKKVPLVLWGPELNRKDLNVGPEVPNQSHVNICGLICSLLGIPLPKDYSGDFNLIEIVNISPERKITLIAMYVNNLLYQLEAGIKKSFGLTSFKFSNSANFFKKNTKELEEAMKTQPNSYNEIQRMLKVSGKKIAFLLDFWHSRLKIIALFICIWIGFILINQSDEENLEFSKFAPNRLGLFAGIFLFFLNLILSTPPVYYIISFSIFLTVCTLKFERFQFNLSMTNVLDYFIEYSTLLLFIWPSSVISILLLYKQFRYTPAEIGLIFSSLASHYVNRVYPSNFLDLATKIAAASAHIHLNNSKVKMVKRINLSVILGIFIFLASTFQFIRILTMACLLIIWILDKRNFFKNFNFGFRAVELIPILYCSMVNSQLALLSLFIIPILNRNIQSDGEILIRAGGKEPRKGISKVFHFWAIQSLLLFPDGLEKSVTDWIIRILAIITLEIPFDNQYQYWAFGPVFSLWAMKTVDEQWRSMTFMLVRHFYIVLVPFLFKPLNCIFNKFSTLFEKRN